MDATYDEQHRLGVAQNHPMSFNGIRLPASMMCEEHKHSTLSITTVTTMANT